MKHPYLLLLSVGTTAICGMVNESSATIRRVPSQYLSIQLAIDSAVAGDTVLVAEGTYFENIRYRGKPITVASLYLIDGDTTHIDKTIIDGSNPSDPDSGSVVYFINGEDTTSVLYGLTITGGKGTLWFFPADNYWHREGGGIFCESSGARILENVITRNRIDETTADGGGVWVLNTTQVLPYLVFERNHVTDNFIRGSATGIFCAGGGVIVWGTSARIVGNLFERDTAAALDGSDAGGLAFQSSPEGPYPVGLIQGNIFRHNVVTTTQRGAFGGGMVVEHTGPVTISDNLFEGKIAVSASSAGVGRGGGLWIGDAYLPGTTAPGRKFIVRNRFLRNRTQCPYLATGSGIELDGTLATVAQNEISENTATGTYGHGGGIWVYRSSGRIENNIIMRNRAPDGGGVQFNSPPMPLRGTDQTIVNNTIVDNDATAGGGLSITEGANVVSLNNILWADTAQNGKEIYVSGGTANVQYCNIQSGWPSGTGNINADPRLVNGTYRLSDSSSCIGAGRDSVQVSVTWYRAPLTDFYGAARPTPIGSHPDIGACENPLANPAVSVTDPTVGSPMSYVLNQNYPNPFNPSTTIKYELPKSSEVRLRVYDILGREVAVLVNERREAGSHEVRFDGAGLASGVYLYRIQAGEFVQTCKMTVVK